MRRCSRCGRVFAADEPAYWSPEGDGLQCAEHNQPGASTLSPASRLLAVRLFQAPPQAFAAEPWPRERALDLRRFLMQSLERHGEQRLQSVGALRRLGG
jgi:DNA repair protein RecO (recombination protein O)